MPSDRWAAHRLIHLLPNSVSMASSGRKPAVKALVRPALRMPTTCSTGISTRPTSQTDSVLPLSRISSKTSG